MSRSTTVGSRMRWAVAIAVLCAVPAFPQGRGGGRGGPPPTAQQAAPFDLAGAWTSVVTEDWMFRMVTPPPGEFLGVPINGAARQVANAWDPAADTAAGNACKAYGAGAIMRRPGRLRISWQDANTLKIDAEAGGQTRLLHFNAATAPAGFTPDWQGFSVAEWNFQNTGQGAARRGTLKVVTTNFKPGYLRKNGVPYSENAVVTDYFDLHTASNGDQWLVVTVAVHDPMYLNTDFITSSHFKKIPDGTTWTAEPCSAN